MAPPPFSAALRISRWASSRRPPLSLARITAVFAPPLPASGIAEINKAVSGRIADAGTTSSRPPWPRATTFGVPSDRLRFQLAAADAAAGVRPARSPASCHRAEMPATTGFPARPPPRRRGKHGLPPSDKAPSGAASAVCARTNAARAAAGRPRAPQRAHPGKCHNCLNLNLASMPLMRTITQSAHPRGPLIHERVLFGELCFLPASLQGLPMKLELLSATPEGPKREVSVLLRARHLPRRLGVAGQFHALSRRPGFSRLRAEFARARRKRRRRPDRAMERAGISATIWPGRSARSADRWSSSAIPWAGASRNIICARAARWRGLC